MKVEYSSTTMKQARVLDALRYQLRELNVFTWSMHHPRDLLCIPVTDSHEGPFIAVGFGAVTKNLHAFVFWTASDARDHVNVIEELTPGDGVPESDLNLLITAIGMYQKRQTTNLREVEALLLEEAEKRAIGNGYQTALKLWNAADLVGTLACKIERMASDVS